MTRDWLRILPLVGLALAAAGCLKKDTHHSLYLSPDGTVVWTVIEKDVRSDEADPAKRRTEEASYLAAAQDAQHPVGLGLASLDPVSLQARILRRQRPFVVMTEAGFDRIDRVFERMLIKTRTPGYAALTHDGTKTTLIIHVETGSTSDDGESSPVTNLFEDADRYRVVLTEGRFVAAQGFTLQDEGGAAKPVAPAEDASAVPDRVYELALTWDTAAPITSGPRTSSGRSSR